MGDTYPYGGSGLSIVLFPQAHIAWKVSVSLQVAPAATL